MHRLRSLLPPLLCLLLFFTLSGLSSRDDAQTSDEAVHLAAGLAHLRTGDLRMNPEHPPLAKLWAALPLLFTDVPLPLDHHSWEQAAEWTFGARFLYRNPYPPDTLLALGRLPILLLGGALLLLVYRWARRLYGEQGAWLAMLLAALEPGLLAHSHYITNDVPLALLYSSSLYVLWRFRTSRHPGWLAAGALLTGLTLGTKYSGLLLLPLVPVALWPFDAGDRSLSTRLRGLALELTVVAAGCYLVLALLYLGEPIQAYTAGLERMQSGWNSFLWGEISERGWYHYFILAALLKTPPASLLIFLIALVSLRRQKLQSGEGLLLLGAGWFFLVSSMLRINIGIRHVLPVLPLLLVFAGRAATFAGETMIRRRVVPALALCTLLEVTAAHPYYIAYFSSLAGGPRQGYRYLSDSNLDWGQDLKRLTRYVQEEKLEAVLLGVFTSADPGAYGLRYQPVPGFGAATFREKPLPTLPDRLVIAMSAMNLQGVYFTAAGSFQTSVPIDPGLYRFLLERPPLLRLTPSIWLFDITHDPEAIYRLGMISLNFGWQRSAAGLFERYLELRPDDSRARTGLEMLKTKLAETEALPAGVPPAASLPP